MTNEEIVRRFIDGVVNGGDSDVVDDLFSSDFVLHLPGVRAAGGRETIKQTSSMFRAAFPDWHDTLEAVVCEGNLVATRWTERGTHRGVFHGLEGAGEPNGS